ncbi:MAG: hypothetical protein V4719_31365 [Planctomycetota bacterium]
MVAASSCPRPAPVIAPPTDNWLHQRFQAINPPISKGLARAHGAETIMHTSHPLNRRQWMAATAGTLAVAACPSLHAIYGASPAPRRLRIAAVVTEFSYRSHAHVILENFLKPYYFNGQQIDSGMDVVSLYVDQFPKDRDIARDVAEKFQITIYPTIAEALQRGGKELAVDGVLSIGEHGDYPDTDHGARMYPRKRFFDEITNVFRSSGRVVPLFNDKHLSYRWDWSAEMMQVVRELQIPFMAGSSVPLAQRRPELEVPNDSVIEEAIAIHGGSLEAYDFHGMELLQSMIEARRGGETGVAEIQLLEGDAVWQAAAEGRWSLPLAEAAMRAGEDHDVGPLRDFIEPGSSKSNSVHAILIKYRDGLRGTILRIGSSATRWKFACRIADKPEPLATSFYVGPWLNRNLFKALSHAIQCHIRDKRSPYPVERTHLVTGMLAAAMDSRFEQHRSLPTPHLDVTYQPRDFRAMREMGATWKLITEDMPEPAGIDPGGPAIARK